MNPWAMFGIGIAAGFPLGVGVTLILLGIVADAWTKAVKFDDEVVK